MSVVAMFLFLMATIVVCVSTFALIVYLKEYAREEKTFNEILKAREKQEQHMGSMPVYVMAAPPAPKKKVASDKIAPKVNKKDVN